MLEIVRSQRQYVEAFQEAPSTTLICDSTNNRSSASSIGPAPLDFGESYQFFANDKTRGASMNGRCIITPTTHLGAVIRRVLDPVWYCCECGNETHRSSTPPTTTKSHLHSERERLTFGKLLEALSFQFLRYQPPTNHLRGPVSLDFGESKHFSLFF